jgi:hypothetical protein
MDARGGRTTSGAARLENGQAFDGPKIKTDRGGNIQATGHLEQTRAGRARAEKGKIEPMARLRRYVEWMNRGRRTDRVVYVTKEWNVPKPLPGAEWQLDTKFNLADELLRDPDLKTVVKAALEKGAEVVIQRERTSVELGPKAKRK